MCAPLIAVAAITVASTALSVASASAQQSAQKKAASKAAFDQNASVLKQEAAEFSNQENTMRYQDKTWQEDIVFGEKTLQYQANEFNKQAAYVAATDKAIQANEDAQFGQTLLQIVQKNLAISLNEANTNTAASQARATAQVQADARGVSGNSVDAIIDDVSRQQGQAVSVMELNRAGIDTQGAVDLAAIKAGTDTALGNLQASVKTYSPSTTIRSPGPVAGVQNATLVSPPERDGLADTLAIVGAGVSGAVSGFKTGTSLTGLTTKDALSGIGNALSIA